MKRKLLLMLCCLCFSIYLFAQEYKQWYDYDFIRFYEKKEIRVEFNSLDKKGNEIAQGIITYFAPTTVKDGVYEVEVYEKVSSKLYLIKGTNIYMYFRDDPYLDNYDKGILNVLLSYGTFYKKP